MEQSTWLDLELWLSLLALITDRSFFFFFSSLFFLVFFFLSYRHIVRRTAHQWGRRKEKIALARQFGGLIKFRRTGAVISIPI